MGASHTSCPSLLHSTFSLFTRLYVVGAEDGTQGAPARQALYR